MKEEKERLIKHYQEQIESLKKALEMLSNEYQRKSSTDKDKININHFHANNIIALSAFEDGVRGQAKKTELDFEMKLLEIESNSSIKGHSVLFLNSTFEESTHSKEQDYCWDEQPNIRNGKRA